MPEATNKGDRPRGKNKSANWMTAFYFMKKTKATARNRSSRCLGQNLLVSGRAIQKDGQHVILWKQHGLQHPEKAAAKVAAKKAAEKVAASSLLATLALSL